jgi:hypothetical protein
MTLNLTLDHEVLDDTMKGCSFEAEWNAIFFALAGTELKQ